MMRIRLNSFGGMFLKVHPTRLQETASTQMQDMLLENGVLTPAMDYESSALPTELTRKKKPTAVDNRRKKSHSI